MRGNKRPEQTVLDASLLSGAAAQKVRTKVISRAIMVSNIMARQDVFVFGAGPTRYQQVVISP